MNNVPVVHCRQLFKSYFDGDIKTTILKGVDLAIAPAEMVAIIGASGAGKSTLLQLMGGLDQPTSGEVWVANQNINQLKEKAKGQLRNQTLGFIYQFHHLLPEFSAMENVAMPLLIAKKTRQYAFDKASKLMVSVGLGHRLQYRIGELSGGERQRVAIARALVCEPKCVLADEPTGNLDEDSALQVYQLMRQLNQQFNTSFVIVTHNLNLARHLDRQLVLDHGVIV